MGKMYSTYTDIIVVIHEADPSKINKYPETSRPIKNTQIFD